MQREALHHRHQPSPGPRRRLTDSHVVKFDATLAPKQVHAAIVAELLAREPLKSWAKGAPGGP